MNEEQMKDFVKERIGLVKEKKINSELPNENGLLIHFIPEQLIEDFNIDLNDKNLNHDFIYKRNFRKLSDLNTQYGIHEDGVMGYTPNNRFFKCFDNGIIETYKHPIITENSIGGNDFDYIKVDNLFFQVRNTLEAAKDTHERLFQSNPPYYIFITLIGIRGIYFYSLDKSYQTTAPFPYENARFEHFIWNDLQENIMSEIVNGIHYGIRAWPGISGQ